MDIDLYHLYRSFHFSKMAYPIVLDVLKVWAESRGWRARVSICKPSAVDLDTDAAAGGISVYSQTAPAAYRVGAELRRRGGSHLRQPARPPGPSRFPDRPVRCSTVCERTG
jgi:hypothetical protein